MRKQKGADYRSLEWSPFGAINKTRSYSLICVYAGRVDRARKKNRMIWIN
jgi:hypothetical protein